MKLISLFTLQDWKAINIRFKIQTEILHLIQSTESLELELEWVEHRNTIQR